MTLSTRKTIPIKARRWDAELAELRQRGVFLWTLEWQGGTRRFLFGRRAHLFSLYTSDGLALHFDLEGRLRRAFFPDAGRLGSHILRGFDGRVVRRGRSLPARTHGDVRRVFARSHSVVLEARASFSHSGRKSESNAASCLHRAAAYNPDRLEAERERFLEVYRPLGILPPDRYRSLVLQLTEGCSYNRCSFCDLYQGQHFRVKSSEEVRDHLRQVKAFFGDALFLRKGVFLGEANALLAPQETLRESLYMMRAEIPEEVLGLRTDQSRAAARGRDSSPPDSSPPDSSPPDGPGGFSSFLDAFTSHGKGVAEFAELRELGLRRVFLGVESGDEELLACLRKPVSGEAVRRTVEIVKTAGISVGILLLVGAGGDQFQTSHVEETVRLLSALSLDAGDVIYLSPLVTAAGGDYEEWARARGIRTLTPVELDEQMQDLRRLLQACGRVAPYNVQRFLYY